MDRLLRHLLAATVLFQGVSGIVGGIGLLVDPTGALLGIPLGWLEGSPFTNYFVPGLVLLVVLGLCPVVVSLALWRRRRWAPAASGAVGAALMIWIIVEILVVGYQRAPPLQAVYGLVGVVILALSLSRRSRLSVTCGRL